MIKRLYVYLSIIVIFMVAIDLVYQSRLIVETAEFEEVPFPLREYDVHGTPFTPTNAWSASISNIQQPLPPLRGAMTEDDLNTALPKQFIFAECLSAHIDIMSSKIVCFQSPGNLPVINKTIILGTDIKFPNIFQHDLINGLPTVGMVAQYLLEDLNERWILSGDHVADVYASMTNNRSIIPLRSVPAGGFWATNVIVPVTDWTYSWDAYPRGSFWPSEIYIENMVNMGHFSHSSSNRYLLFLQRNAPRRYLSQEAEIMENISAMLVKIGWKLVPYPHNSNMPAVEQRRLFFGASIIVGLHGGAFSNIPFTHHETVVIEINNKKKDMDIHTVRDVFANMALSRNLRYFRLVPDSSFDYELANAVELSNRNLVELYELVQSVTTLF